MLLQVKYRDKERSICMLCSGNHNSLNLFSENEGTCAKCFYFILYPFVLVFLCHLSLTAFAVALYFVHRFHLFQISVFV